MSLERRLRDALLADADSYEESPDLFARVNRSLEKDARRRARRRRAARVGAVALAAVVALVAALTDYRQGELIMSWWILEVLVTGLLVGLALFLGPFIKRFGKSYAADVFRANPGTGKSFIVLTDFAYYLIFSAYILFTLRVERPIGWASTVGAAQLQYEVVRVGGILLIIGVLHGINLLVLPIIGRLLTLNRRLEQEMSAAHRPRRSAS